MQVVPDLLAPQTTRQCGRGAHAQRSFARAAQPLGAGVVTLLEAGPAARIGVACGKKFLETLALAQGIEILEQPDQCRCTHLHGAVAARVVQAYQNREFAPGVRYAQACAQRAHCRRAELFVPMSASRITCMSTTLEISPPIFTCCSISPVWRR